MRKQLLILVLILLPLTVVVGQTTTAWKGKKAAVVITYDDALNEHLDNAVPLLDSLGLKATFYLTGFSTSMQARLNDWKRLAVNGHELGNHTLFHPCAGGTGREWVKPDQDLNKYTFARMVEEIQATNLLLQSMDGNTSRTFAFTCGDTNIGGTSYVPLIKNKFVAMRGVSKKMSRINAVNLDNVDCYVVNGETGPQLIEWVKQAQNTNSLLVLLFHGVGGGNGLNVSLEAHRTLLQYVKTNEQDIWVAPMLEVANYIKEYKRK